MNIFKKAYCRAFQAAFRIALPLLPYREPEIIRSCAEIGSVAARSGIRSALIVTDSGIVNAGLVAPLEEALKSSGVHYAVYDQTQPNPTVDNVAQALAMYYEHSCSCLIAIGGGSSMDCAKAVGARIAYPKKQLGQMKGILRVLRRLPTLIAIPTTAGTGSETTLAAVVTDPEKQHKYALMSFPLIPHYAVLDAALTYSLPQHLTATTGMDALTHAVEAYIGGTTTAETRRLALEATTLIFRNIRTAYSNGSNHEARSCMLLAAYKAGVAFSKSYVGYIHAVAHSLSGQYGTPHGLANAVIMPYVLSAYGTAAHKKLAELGVAAGVCAADEPYAVGAEKFIAAVKALNASMNIPEKLSGIRREDIPVMSRHAEKEGNPLYPVPKLMTQAELERFYYEIADWGSEA